MKFSAAILFSITSVGLVTALGPSVCTQSERAPFPADCLTAIDFISDDTPACGDTVSFRTLYQSALSCNIYGLSTIEGKSHCLDKATLKAAARQVIQDCTFDSVLGSKTEGQAEFVVGSGNSVSVEWSNCGGSGCSSPLRERRFKA